MKQGRLEALADGIFAIVMTLLVFEIKVPALGTEAGDFDLLFALSKLSPLFLSYLLSFATLFAYWRAHHFVASIFAKNIDIKFTNINAIFLFFVALVPFSSHFLGNYNKSPVGVIVFALNIIAIGLSLYSMRNYARVANTIENTEVSETEHRHAHIRILFPVFSGMVAMVLAFYSTNFALTVLTLAVLFNLSRSSTRFVDKLFGWK